MDRKEKTWYNVSRETLYHVFFQDTHGIKNIVLLCSIAAAKKCLSFSKLKERQVKLTW